MNPQVPIDVDEKTGVWTTDALPMLYVPRHFLVNNHEAVEQALGRRPMPPSSMRRATSRLTTGATAKPGSTAYAGSMSSPTI